MASETDKISEDYRRGFLDGLRAALQTFGGIFNDESRACGELSNPVLQAIRSRVKRRLSKRLLEDVDRRWSTRHVPEVRKA